MENYYNVVVAVFGEDSDTERAKQTSQIEIPNDYKKRFVNRQRIQKEGKLLYNIKNAQTFLKRKNREDQNYREKKLKTAFERYNKDEEFQENVRFVSKQRYHTDNLYQNKAKLRSTKK